MGDKSTHTSHSWESHAQVESISVSKCCGKAEYYVLNQAVAIVRHADRLDQTPEWLRYPDREKYYADTPITAEGHVHAGEAGKALSEVSAKLNIPFALIVSSPYYRCAQTASRISRELHLPIQFDLDLGEIFHADLCKDGRPVHRDKEVLQATLQEEFPDVEYIKDADGSLMVRGKQPKWPERVMSARLRFAFKVQELARQSALKLSSLIIVTHADSLAAIASLLKPNWVFSKIPYTGYLVASRQVKVYDKLRKRELPDEPVYGKHVQWTIDVGPGFEVEEDDKFAEKSAKEKHTLKENQQKLKAAQSTNSLSCLPDDEEEDSPHDKLVSDLTDRGATPKEAKQLMKTTTKAFSSRKVFSDTTDAVTGATKGITDTIAGAIESITHSLHMSSGSDSEAQQSKKVVI